MSPRPAPAPAHCALYLLANAGGPPPAPCSALSPHSQINRQPGPPCPSRVTL